jgi:hypothetical protein
MSSKPEIKTHKKQSSLEKTKTKQNQKQKKNKSFSESFNHLTKKRTGRKSKLRLHSSNSHTNDYLNEKEEQYSDYGNIEDDEDIEIEDEDLKSLDIEENLFDNKKIQKYKFFLTNLRDKVYKLFEDGKYNLSITELNKELSKTDDRYLHNEILKISEELKFEHYKNNPIKDELTYPSYYDQDFSQKIYKKAEFYQNKLDKVLPSDVDRIINERKSGVISLAQHQRFLKNFMSRNTPYNGLLIFHGLGVGKTCASIAIAETLRPTVLANNQKIIIIAKSHFDKGEIFNMDRFKKGQNQCAGDTVTNELKNPELLQKCREGGAEACKIVKYKIDKIVKNSYSFYGALEWAKHVVKDLQKAVRGVPESRHHEVEIARIKKMYSNTVMIIDEAHNIKDASEKKSRIVPPVLMKVLEHAENLRLVLLSGTPMFNEPSDLISILNYLLINDKRPILKESEVFKSDGSFTPKGREILTNYSRGYVSFLRSENPINYPLRFSASINGGTEVITPSKYPTKDIYGNKLEQGIQHLEITGCPMSKQQEKVYKAYLEKRIMPDEEKTSAAYSSELQILNFIYQNLDDTDNVAECYGEKGLNSVLTKVSNKQQYSFNNPADALEYKGEALKLHSSKIHKIMENIEKAQGLVFVYTEYENSGILPLAFALELAGYRKYKSSDTPVLLSEHKESKYKGDYLIISGNAALSKYYENYLDKRHDMIKEPVKVILATRAASEGISLFGVREIHILNPWHNLNRISQAIGRGIRSWSHIDLPSEERNITVYIYAATFGNQETVDLKIYREAENKAINIGIAEDILRRNAVDCHLNKDGNHYSEKDWSEKVTVKTSRGEIKNVSVYDKPFSHVCHYLKNCDYKCFNPPEKYDLETKDLDYSTYNLSSLKYETNELTGVISKIFRQEVILTLDKILAKMPSKYLRDVNLVYQALQDMIDNKKEIHDKYGRPGYLIYRGNFYIFQPTQINNQNLFLYQRSIPPPIRPNMIDLSDYINKIGQQKVEIGKKDVYNMTEVMEYVENQIHNIQNNTPDAIFSTNYTLTNEEVYQIVLDRLIASYKRVILNNLLLKDIKNQDMTSHEKLILKCLENNIIRKGYVDHSRDKSIYGFRLIENDQQVFYKYQIHEGVFDYDAGIQLQMLDTQKIKYSNMNFTNHNDFYGYLKYDKIDQGPSFKIRDLTKGDKKAIKGITCSYKSRKEIYEHFKSIEPKAKEISNKKMMCDDIEIVLRRNDAAKKNNLRWFFSAEEAKERDIIDSL